MKNRSLLTGNFGIYTVGGYVKKLQTIQEHFGSSSMRTHLHKTRKTDPFSGGANIVLQHLNNNCYNRPKIYSVYLFFYDVP